MQMYIYRVAPKSKTKTQNSYDYLSELQISPGTIVKIELGKSKVEGVVVGISKEINFATKQILKTVSQGPVFTQNQMKLAEIIQDEYLTAFGETLFAFLPTMNVSDIKKIGTEPSISQKKHRKNELFISSHSNRLSFYIELCSKTEGQILVVLPEIEQIDRIYKNLKKILPSKKIYRYYGAIESRQKRMIWSELQKGADAIVLSTRHGLLLPFTSLSLICVDDPLNFAHQEDQVPYYQAFFVSRKLRDLSGCKLVIGESIPDLNSFAAIKNKKISIRSVNNNLKVFQTAVFSKFDQNIFLIKTIKSVLRSKSRVCFIGPWKNHVKLVCEDCKSEIYCQACQEKYFDQNNLSCVKCSSQIFSCTKCKSSKIKSVGFSYKAIENKIIATLPEFKDQVTTYPSLFKNNSIIIASPNEIADCSTDYEIAILPYFDKMADFASLGYRHKIFRFIYDLPRLSVRQVFLCGDKLSEDKFASQIINFSYEEFLSDELRTRSQIKLPPFSKAIEAVIKTANYKSAIEQFEKISKATGLSITPIKQNKRLKYTRTSGLFFVENSNWPSVKNILKDLNLKNCHFEVDRGEYL